ncbi:MAG: ribonuclease Z [Isosphaeraceae bacterium]|nr:ribonuclease Z [Isosphaeraceae bacterium]
MSRLQFVCLGVGDAFSARWYSSALAVGYGDSWLLVDCPHPIRKILREAGATAGIHLDVDRFAGVALTHLHADHASGLEDWGFYSLFALKRKTALLTHPEVARDLWDRHLAATMGALPTAPGGPVRPMELTDYFDLSPLREEAPTAFGPFAIECRRTLHPIPTFALRLRAGGRLLGLSADTAFDPALIAWLAEADLIVHETNRGLHTPYEKLAALPEALRRKMRLIHYPDDFDVAGSLIEPLRQGGLYHV